MTIDKRQSILDMFTKAGEDGGTIIDEDGDELDFAEVEKRLIGMSNADVDALYMQVAHQVKSPQQLFAEQVDYAINLILGASRPVSAGHIRHVIGPHNVYRKLWGALQTDERITYYRHQNKVFYTGREAC